MPSASLSAIKQNMGRVKVPVTATSPDAETGVVEGELNFIDNVIDASTDTIKLKARFENHDRRLWPGQFARVSLRVTTIPHALVLPGQAVQTGQDGQFVFLVKPDNTVAQQPVTVGQRIGEDVVVEKGLEAGQTVVTEGQLRLEAGTRIQTGDGRQGGGGRRGAPEGRAGRAGQARRAGRAPRRVARPDAHERLRDLHQAADRHQPADGGHRDVRRRRVPRAARQRSADGGLPHDSDSGGPAGRRSRARWRRRWPARSSGS